MNNFEYKHWNEYWVNTKNPPIYENPPIEVYGGTNIEPLASIGMSCFTDASRDNFKENFSIIDYGCGAGILSNFISERLDSFKYFGLEPNNNWGSDWIERGKKYFNDSRVNFGFTDDYNKIIENNKIDTVILISVFTHLLIDDITAILDNLIKVFDKSPDCNIVFSCFTSEEERVGNLQPNIWERFYGTSHIKESDLFEYCDKHGLKLNKHMSFSAQGGHIHEIFKIEKI